MFLSYFDVFCVLLLRRLTATWNRFVLCNEEGKKLMVMSSKRLSYNWSYVRTNQNVCKTQLIPETKWGSFSNSFLYEVMGKCDIFSVFILTADSLFVLGNAQIMENPIVYSSDGFCKFTGYTRAEVMKKNCDCNFLFGQQTDPETIRELHNALQAKTAIQKEFIAYQKDGKMIRYESRPISNWKYQFFLNMY